MKIKYNNITVNLFACHNLWWGGYHDDQLWGAENIGGVVGTNRVYNSGEVVVKKRVSEE